MTSAREISSCYTTIAADDLLITDGCYKFVDDMMGLVKYGPPSLIKCTKLTIEGKMYFEKNVVFEGEVRTSTTVLIEKIFMPSTSLAKEISFVIFFSSRYVRETTPRETTFVVIVIWAPSSLRR